MTTVKIRNMRLGECFHGQRRGGLTLLSPIYILWARYTVNEGYKYSSRPVLYLQLYIAKLYLPVIIFFRSSGLLLVQFPYTNPHQGISVPRGQSTLTDAYFGSSTKATTTKMPGIKPVLLCGKFASYTGKVTEN